MQNDFSLQQAVSSKIVKPIPDELYQRKNPDATVNSPVRYQREVAAQTEMSMLGDEVGLFGRENKTLKNRLDAFADHTSSKNDERD